MHQSANFALFLCSFCINYQLFMFFEYIGCDPPPRNNETDGGIFPSSFFIGTREPIFSCRGKQLILQNKYSVKLLKMSCLECGN